MDGVVLDSKSNVVFVDKPKLEKMAKDSTGTSGRKMLADISNMQRTSTTLTIDNKSQPNSATVKEYIEKLQKENAALMKVVADKKIIEISGSEVQKLTITLQKMQQQNLQLAQSRSQILAELNSGKDRIKELHHQLGCKNSLLVAKDLELEGKRKAKTNETIDTKKVKVSKHEVTEDCIVAERDKEQHYNNTNGKQKFKSLGPSVRKVQEKGVDDNGRVLKRRQSARFKHDEPKPAEDLFKTDDRMQEDDSNSVTFSVKQENVGGDGSLTNEVTQENKRLSISRPSREAAKKVQSYKEISLVAKMRRPE